MNIIINEVEMSILKYLITEGALLCMKRFQEAISSLHLKTVVKTNMIIK